MKMSSSIISKLVSAATFMMPRRWAIYDIQIINTLDNCYFLYGTPMVGDSEYDDVLGAFTSDTIVWHEMCTLPWTMNEMEVNITIDGAKLFVFHGIS